MFDTYCYLFLARLSYFNMWHVVEAKVGRFSFALVAGFSLLCLSSLTSCSLKPKDKSGFATVRFSKGSSQSLSRQVSRALSQAGAPGARSLAFTDFTCFGIQVSGGGISGDSRLGCPAQGGILAGLIPAGGGELEVLVPTGAQRTVKIFGLKTTGGCPTMETLANLSPQTRFTGLDLPYELGSATLDIFHDVDVTIQAKFDPAAPTPVFTSSCWANAPSSGHSGLALSGASVFIGGQAQSVPANCAVGSSHPCLRGRFALDHGRVTGGVSAPSPGQGLYSVHFGQATTEPERGL